MIGLSRKWAATRKKADGAISKLRVEIVICWEAGTGRGPVAPVVLQGRTIASSFWGKIWCDNLEETSGILEETLAEL